jgi:chromosome segregation ATPase
MRDYISGLSGGERSFSTICFMVSMWKAMEAPFYILDEFDVFMDQANRKASHLILNAHTRSQPEAQFIFITPLKLDSIINPENAKVLR